MNTEPSTAPQAANPPMWRSWPWVVGTLLAPALILTLQHPDLLIRHANLLPVGLQPLFATPASLAATLSIVWVAFWTLLYVLANLPAVRHALFGKRQTAPGKTADVEKISAQQIAQINQHWITPLGHIRAATDAIAAANESALLNERLTPDLSVIRSANAQLRLAIENLLDYYEISNHRLKATPRKTDIRLQMEDAVAEWQVSAQHNAGIIQYICYQDIPSLVAVDIRLLRRLLDNLLAVLLEQTQLLDCCVTLLDADQEETDLRIDTAEQVEPPMNQFELVVDAQTPEPLDQLAENLHDRRQRVEAQTVEPLFSGGEISAWLIEALAEQLNATLHIGITRPGRYGFRLRFSAPILAEHQAWQPLMEGKRCAVLTESPTHAQAWRGHLSAYGADIVLDPAHDRKPVDCLFVDRATWQKLNEKGPAWFTTLPESTLVIALCNRISLRGRPMSLFDWAHISLPIFVRQRVLQTLLPRILTTQNQPARPAVARPSVAPMLDVEPPAQNNPSFKGRTALVIDDDRIYQTHLKNLLTQLGMNTLTAADGKSGLYSAEQSDLDLILTDMHLPDILGTGIVRMMRKQSRHEHTPIIAITANVQTEVHQALLAAGADMVLTKPIALGELINAISQFIQPAHTTPPRTPNEARVSADPVLNSLLCDELPIYRQTLAENQYDLQSLRHIAHKLRGAAACCQAKQLQTHAGRLEDSIVAAAGWSQVEQLKRNLVAVIDQTIDERHCQTITANTSAPSH
ncbi:response regulator [Halothiobacillus diazotrophicus]|nr:response regulator [Halothiobacillus diazotrophicus]